MIKLKVGIIGVLLIDLAEQLSSEHCEVTADEILEHMRGLLISEQNAGEICKWLST